MSTMDVPSEAESEIPASQPRAKKPAVPGMTWVTLALMTTASVASLRSAPTMAVYGLACVFLYVVPAIVFLMPTALVSAELASGCNGGVYRWVSEGLSKVRSSSAATPTCWTGCRSPVPAPSPTGSGPAPPSPSWASTARRSSARPPPSRAPHGPG